MARIVLVYNKYFWGYIHVLHCQLGSVDTVLLSVSLGPWFTSFRSIEFTCDLYYRLITTFYHARPIILEKTITKYYGKFDSWFESRALRIISLMHSQPDCWVIIILENIVDFAQNNESSMSVDVFSTPVKSFWLICTTRRWDRGSIWGHTLFLSELNFRVKIRFFSRSRPSFDFRCEPCIVPKKILNGFFFFCKWKFSEKHTFFSDRSKQLLVVQIPEVTVYQENAEHIRLTTFHWQSETVEMGGTCLGDQKSIQ